MIQRLVYPYVNVFNVFDDEIRNILNGDKTNYLTGFTCEKMVSSVQIAEEKKFPGSLVGKWSRFDEKNYGDMDASIEQAKKTAQAMRDYLGGIGIQAVLTTQDSFSDIPHYSKKDFRYHTISNQIRYQVSKAEMRNVVQKSLDEKVAVLKKLGGKWTERMAASGAIEPVVNTVLDLYQKTYDVYKAYRPVTNICIQINNVGISLSAEEGKQYYGFHDLGYKFLDEDLGHQFPALYAAIIARLRLEFDRPSVSYMNLIFTPLEEYLAYSLNVHVVSENFVKDPGPQYKSW